MTVMFETTHCLQDIFTEAILHVWNVTNKSAPVLVSYQTTPGAFTHNTWLTDNSRILLTTDEVSNSYLTAYDIIDPYNITELDRIQSQFPSSGSIVHNTHVRMILQLHHGIVTELPLWMHQGAEILSLQVITIATPRYPETVLTVCGEYILSFLPEILCVRY